MATVPSHCTKCRNAISLPTLEGTEDALASVQALTEESPVLDRLRAVGTAQAFLFMFAGCLRGICIFCQDYSAQPHAQREALS